MCSALLPQICGALDPVATVRCVIVLGKNGQSNLAAAAQSTMKKFFADEAPDALNIAKGIIGDILSAQED